MVVDTSAVVAIYRGEEDAPALSEVLDRVSDAFISAASVVELGMVLEGAANPAASGTADYLLRSLNITLVPVAQVHVDRAMEGWRRFGKGNHPAALNFGDCFTYALASTRNLPVLCTGNDFAQTDVAVVPLGDLP